MRQVIGKGMLATAAATSILSLSGTHAFAAGADGVATDSPGILSGNSVQAPVEVPVNACGNSANAVGVGNPTMGNSCANSEAPKQHAEAPKRHAAVPKQHAVAPKRAATQEPAATKTHDRSGHGSGHGSGYGDDSDRDAYQDTHAGTQSLAESEASHSPGILSGNDVQALLDIPVNACGNTVDVIAALNPAFGNGCANGAPAPTPPQHETPHSPETPPRSVEPPTDRAMPPVKAGQPPQYVASSTSRQMPSAAHEAPHAVARLAETGSDQDLLAAAAASAALLVGGGILYRRGFASSGR
ncbi:chaplin family protein [Streptomyces sp. NBC_01283]|uniref:chaplin n=1 Tax=Streptomyces sp. NBC_01283 TaxID=2903812 RepID=UPI00352CD3AE